MEYRILGSIEVLDAGRPVQIGPGKPLSLLAFLILHANEVVTSDRIVEELWDGRAPQSAAKIVQNAVSQLRKALAGSPNGAADSLVTRGGGYVLEIEAGQRDVDRFTSLLSDGRRLLADDQPASASATLTEALSLWRGPPLAEVAYESFAQREILRLEEIRLEVLEERIQGGPRARAARSGRGRARCARTRASAARAAAIPADARALQVRPAGGGAQVYQDARETLVDELGIEPGRGLQELERGILNQSPELDAPPRPEAVQRRHRARAVLVLGAAAVLLAAAAAALRVFGDDEPLELSSVAANSVGIVDPASARLVGQVPVPGGPALVAAGDGLVWIESETSNTLTVLDESAPHGQADRRARRSDRRHGRHARCSLADRPERPAAHGDRPGVRPGRAPSPAPRVQGTPPWPGVLRRRRRSRPRRAPYG